MNNVDQALQELSQAFMNPHTTLGTCRGILAKAFRVERLAALEDAAQLVEERARAQQKDSRRKGAYLNLAAKVRALGEQQAVGAGHGAR